MAEKINLKKVKEFFGMSLPDMKKEWVPLPQKDKNDIWKGIEDGSLNY